MVESGILRWTGHVIRMGNDRIPKKLLYGRLASGRSTKGNHASYRNQVKRILRTAGIPPVTLEPLTKPRIAWQKVSKTAIAKLENDRINCLIQKRELRKQRAGSIPHPQPP